MSEHQPHDPQSTPEALPTAASTRGVSASRVSTSRRNLLRGGLAGAPALLALKSTPVVACTCKLPSGFTVSGNLSRGPKNCVDRARRASTWASSTNCKTASPNQYYSGTTNYAIYKGTLVGSGTTGTGTPLSLITTGYSGTTVGSWLALPDDSVQGMLMACYLESVVSGGPNFPTTAMIKSMWNTGVQGTGYTVPNQTVKWNKDQVIGYLRYLTGFVV